MADGSRVGQLIVLFERALEVPRAQRRDFVERECGDDAALREELSSLLEAHESAPDYFDQLAEEVSPAYRATSGAPPSTGDADLLPRLQEALGAAYRIERELGGGMSRVFLAEEVKLGRRVVIKVLPPELAASASAERFRREIQLAAQLQHPHVVPLLTSESAGSFLYYTMPFVAGESLRARLAREGALSISDARQVWRDMLDALAHAHASGVIHRDIKPANILLSARSALVSDFGIARAIQAAGDASETATGLSIGTPAYMAPEQVTGERDVDHRADIYAAGLVMYEMLEGRPPFTGDSIREIALARLTRDPGPIVRPDCPAALVQLVLQCLARTPDARPQTAEAILAELETISSSREPATTVPKARSFRSRRVAAYGLAALALLALSLSAKRLTRDRQGTTAVATPMPSLAVLPLQNLSTDPADVALTDGMTQSLSAMLARTRKLRVIGRISVFAFKDQRMDPRQIAESLRVSHVLDGALQKVGQRMRLRVHLLDPRAGRSLWSGIFDREIGDVFVVQDSISRAVIRTLGVHSGRLASGRTTDRRHTPSIEAFMWYLRGMGARLRRGREVRAARDQAIDYLNRAIAADSNFAAPYADLARLYFDEVGDEAGKARGLYSRSEEAARKAFALDDSLADAHSALGWSHIRDGVLGDSTALGNLAAAEAEFNKAIALDPSLDHAYAGLALVYLWLERPAQQLDAARRGVEVDPFNYATIRHLGLALSMNGRCAEAIERLRPLQALSAPGSAAGVVTGVCYAAKQMWPEAIAEFRWGMEGGGRAALAFLAYAQARAGQRDEAMKVLADLLAGRKYSHGAFGIATVYLGLDNYDEAIRWLIKSVDEGSVRPYIMGPLFEELRRDPRFAEVRRRLGL